MGPLVACAQAPAKYSDHVQTTPVSFEILRPVAEERLWKRNHMARASGKTRPS